MLLLALAEKRISVWRVCRAKIALYVWSLVIFILLNVVMRYRVSNFLFFSGAELLRGNVSVNVSSFFFTFLIFKVWI